MLKQFFVLAVLVAAVITIAAAKDRHHSYGGHSLNISTHDDRDSNDCADHLDVWSDDLSARVSGEETQTLANAPLRIIAAKNGGIQVRNWDKPEIVIKVCKVALANSEDEAKRLLAGVHAQVANGEVTVAGPSGHEGGDWSAENSPMWTALIMVSAPKGAKLDLNAHNGGISLRKTEVIVTAHTINGGISLDHTAGKVNVEAQNGGISVKDCSGDVNVEVQNGGLSIALSDEWKGAGLEARTHNGGLVVEVPDSFKSSLEVAMLGHGSIICKDSVCNSAQKTWDNDSRLIRIGGDHPVVRASTVNGGVVVKSRSSHAAEY